MSLLRITISFLLLVYILATLSGTLYLSKFYFKVGRKGIGFFHMGLTLFSTFLYFFTAGYIMQPLIGELASTLIAMLILAVIAWSVYSIDNYNANLSKQFDEMDLTLDVSTKEIDKISSRIQELNNELKNNDTVKEELEDE